jgi:RNA polymerase sigma-70 factor (ECF subfamily)
MEASSPALADALAAAFAGEGSGIAAVYDLAGADLYAYATWLVGRELAEEVVQEVFLRLLRTHDRSRVVRHPRAYLLTIARHAAADLRRTEPTTSVDAEHLERLVDPASPDPEAVLDAERASRALATLPRSQREAVTLRYLLDLSYADIGRITGVSLFTAASRARLGLARLTRSLSALPRRKP